jgi:hypothetical protein
VKPLKKINSALWISAITIAVIILLPCTSAQLIDVGKSPSQESYQLGINKPSLGALYSEYYAMQSGPAPAHHISFPVQFNITGSAPMTVYFSNQQQPVPFAAYQSSPAYNASNSLWTKGSSNWTQYAAVPLGSTVSLIAISPAGGSGDLVLTDTSGQTSNYNYYFYPHSQLTFYAYEPGRHTLSFTTGGTASNNVVIDVAGVSASTSSYRGTYPGI